eukprot:TRINITY_DN12425_c2_g1_i1.p1 TRINITY_DN12425_c2_g1~~TRINITY_DN12425_c2_g1_i1.p1  ORF type:complete len:386 (-),score=34.59 TRINITY_DN12425_c2_g1_i1:236-1393(-)
MLMAHSSSEPTVLNGNVATGCANLRMRLPSIHGNSTRSSPIARRRARSSSDAHFPSGGAESASDLACSGASSSECSPIKSSFRRRMTLKEDARNEQPTLDAMRQLLLQRAGSLKQAYVVLDVHKTGHVTLLDFKVGLNCLHINVSPFAEYPSFEKLFKKLAAGATELSLEHLLGYVPIGNSRTQLDTRTVWLDYHNKTSALRKVAREPAWRSKGNCTAGDVSPTSDDERLHCQSGGEVQTWTDKESARMRRRRDLKAQFREVRGNMQTDQKRGLVHGMVRPEKAQDHFLEENRKMLIKRQKIESAIRDCSKARLAVVNMKTMMSHVQPKTICIADDQKHSLQVAFGGRLSAFRSRTSTSSSEPPGHCPKSVASNCGDHAQSPFRL